MEEPEEEVAEESAAEEEVESKVSWREDVLLRVMDAAGIDVSHRDEFVVHAANFDLDENGYLKKAELQAAAEAWNAEATTEEVAEEAAEEVAEEAAEEVAEEEPAVEEAAEDAAAEKACPICPALSPADATTCVCSYIFV